MDLFAKLTATYKNYVTRTETDEGVDFFVIVNPFWNENIRITYDNGILLLFSHQHAHCDDNFDLLTDYIDAFLHRKEVAIEFFSGDKPLFGGSKCLDDIDMSSGKSLYESFIGDRPQLFLEFYKRIKGVNCRCSIRGWDNALNKDINFVL